MKPIVNMLLHVIGKNSKSSCGGPAFRTIRKVLFIFRKKKPCYGPVWTAMDRKHGQLIVTALVVAPDNCSYQLANLEVLANCT